MPTVYIDNLINNINTLNNTLYPKQTITPISPPIVKTVASNFELKKLEIKTAELEKAKSLKNPTKTTKSTATLCTADEINAMIDNECATRYMQTWGKLTLNIKLNRINEYVKTTLKHKYNLNDDSINNAVLLLSNLVQNKKLLTAHVKYDKELGIISNIPKLIYDSATKLFTF